MKLVTRIALISGAVALAAAAALTERLLVASGVFTAMKPGFAGTCRSIADVAGPEDIEVDRQSKLAFVSATDRRAFKRGTPSAQDGLYVLAPGGSALTKLSGTPKDFHPHGISLYRDPDGSLTLMAISHHLDGTSSVEIFDVAFQPGPVLHEIGRIESGQLVSPNAVAAIDKDRFYVANDHTSRTLFGRILDDDLLVPRANVLYFDGSVFRAVVDGLLHPNGIALSPDGNHLYVSEAYARQLRTYERDPFSGALTEAGRLPIPSNLDNVRVDADGNLWIGSHPKAFAMAAYRSDAAKPAPSEVFKVVVSGGVPQSVELVYADRGDGIGGSSVAAPMGSRLLIGSPYDTKILDCTLPN